jgi:PAS domain S-box-containing protein
MTVEQDVATSLTVSILVVDDREENRLALRAILEMPGYKIVEADSGPQALRRLLTEEEDFAVLLIDVVMPGMSGLELVSLIKQRPRMAAVPVVFLTAHAQDVGLLFEGYRVGAVDYLLKPLAPEIVRAKVAVFAELHRRRKRLERQGARLVEAERREAELRLLELRLAAAHRYRNLADSIPHVVWTAGPDGVVDYFNRRWFEYTGLSVEESAGSWQKAVHPEDMDRCRAAWEKASRAGGEFRAEVRLRRADGALRWHKATAIPETGVQGEVVSWVGTFTDIEDQMEARRAREEFLTVASHELKTPLSSLQLLMGQLLRKADRPPDERLKLEKVGRQIERCASLIAELLDVTRITSGGVLSLEEVDLSALAREATSRLSEDAAKAGSPIEVKADAPVRIRVDRTRMDQVVTNLVTNALKFGAGKPVEVSVEAIGARARIVVVDHGIGVDPADAEKIFERYVRGASATRYGGIGLGLYIVRQIVLAHGGTIHLESKPGVGSTFIIDLPPEPPPAAKEEGVELGEDETWRRAAS